MTQQKCPCNQTVKSAFLTEMLFCTVSSVICVLAVVHSTCLHFPQGKSKGHNVDRSPGHYSVAAWPDMQIGRGHKMEGGCSWWIASVYHCVGQYDWMVVIVHGWGWLLWHKNDCGCFEAHWYNRWLKEMLERIFLSFSAQPLTNW